MFHVNPLPRIHMEYQVLFSMKKKIQDSSAAVVIGAIRVIQGKKLHRLEIIKKCVNLQACRNFRPSLANRLEIF